MTDGIAGKDFSILFQRDLLFVRKFFAHQLAAAFDDLGYETTVCEFTSQDDLDAVLSPFFGKKYRAVFDFNSLLPRLAMDDGTPVIDLFDGPFYDYIVDHPLFHYNCLMTRAKNFHAIVLDEGQADYVKKYHPQVKSVHMLPLGATIALFDGEKIPQIISFLWGLMMRRKSI